MLLLAGIPQGPTLYPPHHVRKKNDPVALACMDYGYSIVPSQSDKDEQGRLLDDPFDPRCTQNGWWRSPPK